MEDNRHIILRCDLYNIIELERGCCGQILYQKRNWFWKSWVKKFFQFQNGRLHIWKPTQSHKKCTKLNIKSSSLLTNIVPKNYLTGYKIYKFDIIKGNGKYKYTFASPRREKILLLWNQIYSHIHAESSEIFFSG
tara:strand:- start:386 stop:790 length:405 start_codon:yes stop_codon:yes gene_type:complete